MKLTYLITSLNFGGAEIGMTRLINGIKESERADEFEITVISVANTPRDVVDLLPESVTVHHLDIEHGYQLQKTKPLWRELRNTDILVCSLYHASVLGVLFGLLRQVPQIMTWQHNSEYRSSTARRVYSLCYQFSDDILADSEAVRDMLLSDFDVPPSKVSVLPIAGVDTDFFSPAADSIEFSNDQSVQIGTIGRLTHQKGYDYLLECAERIDDAHFHVIGEGELEEELQLEATKRGLDNVTFHGKVPYESLPSYLASFDIYFQPSRYEGLCMTVIEAMSSGLPIVASETGGIRESVVNNKNGYLVESGDISGYVKKTRVLIGSYNLREEYGLASRRRAVKIYSRQVFTNKFYKILYNYGFKNS